jgi:dTMP kinase
MNRLITFEGVEGSGKSTQLKLLGEYLLTQSIAHILTLEPAGTPIGRLIGDILFNRKSSAMFPETELLLFFAARAQHVREVVIPALNAGQWVLCDRFSDATFAYQAAGRGLEEGFVSSVNDYSACGLMPGLTLLFDLPVETGLLRAGKRDIQLADPAAADRFEREKLDFHNRVRDKYLSLSRENPDRFRIINADRSVEDISSDVSRHAMDYINHNS